MFKKILQKPWWFQLVLAIGLLLIIIFTFFQSLKFFTHHGSYLKIPDVGDKTVDQATAILTQQGFEVWIQDSVYYDTLPPLMVVKQFPEPDASVKVNRVVYLTINRAVPPEIEMPNLVGMSLRNAQLEMKTRGLKVDKLSYKPDIAKNAVLEQSVAGNTIKAGTKVTMGTKVSLVLGSGIGSEELLVPDLFSLNYDEAVALLEGSGLMVGSVIKDGNIDLASSYVFRQQPQRFREDGTTNKLRKGQMVDIWVSSSRPETTSNESSDDPLRNF